MLSDTFPVILSERDAGSGTTGSSGALMIRAKTTGAMANGFGGEMQFRVTDSGNTNVALAAIGATRQTDDTSGMLSFYTYKTGSRQERVVIDEDGKVGIGTVTPNAGLDVADTGDVTNPTIQVGYATSTRANYRFGLYSDSEAGYLSNKNGNNGIRFIHRGGTVMQVGYGSDATTPYVGDWDYRASYIPSCNGHSCRSKGNSIYRVYQFCNGKYSCGCVYYSRY